MRPIVYFGLIALANSLTDFDSYLLDDMSGLAVDDAEPGSDLLFNNDPLTFVREEAAAEPDVELSSLLFSEEAEPDSESSPFLFDDEPYLNADTSADTIAMAKDCPSTLAPLNRMRRRANHCIDDRHPQLGNQLPTVEDLVNERIKRQWCSNPPSPTFGNIPVVRLNGAELKTVEEDLLPPGPLSLPPIGFFNVLEGILRKSIERLWFCRFIFTV